MDESMQEGPESSGPDGFDRRKFLTRVGVGAAFAVPVVTSFSMVGVNSVYAAEAAVSGSTEGSTAGSTGGSTTTTTTPVAGGSTATTTTAPTTTTTSTSTTVPPSTTTTTFIGNLGNLGNQPG